MRNRYLNLLSIYHIAVINLTILECIWVFFAHLYCSYILLNNIKIFSVLVVCLFFCKKKGSARHRTLTSAWICVCTWTQHSEEQALVLCQYFLLTLWTRTYSVLHPKPQPSSVREALGQSEGKNASPRSVRRLLYQCKPEWWRCGGFLPTGHWAFKEESFLRLSQFLTGMLRKQYCNEKPSISNEKTKLKYQNVCVWYFLCKVHSFFCFSHIIPKVKS